MTLINNLERPENHPTLNMLELGPLQIYPDILYLNITWGTAATIKGGWSAQKVWMSHNPTDCQTNVNIYIWTHDYKMQQSASCSLREMT